MPDNPTTNQAWAYRATSGYDYGSTIYWIPGVCHNIETEPTARLIAAAPDLLKALRDVVRVADRATVEFDAARAAIAKAEGSTHA